MLNVFAPSHPIGLIWSNITLVPTHGNIHTKDCKKKVSGVFLCGNSLHVNDLVDYVSNEGEVAGKWAAAHLLDKK